MELRPFAALLPSPKALEERPDLTKKARDQYRDFRAAGVYQARTTSSFYILRLHNLSGEVFLGLIGLLPSMAYCEGAILPHEATLEKGRKKQTKVLNRQRAMTKPVLLTYPQVPVLAAALELAVRDAELLLRHDQYGFQFEYLAAPIDQSARLIAAWEAANIRPIVADGHHRLASASALSPDGESCVLEFFPALLIPGAALELDTFYRLISPAGDQSPAELMDDLESYFTIRKVGGPFKPTEAGEWAFALDGQYYQLNRRPVHALSNLLDPVWFNNYILPRLFNIEDSQKDPRIFSREMGSKGPDLEELATDYRDHAIFAGYPIKGGDFFDLVNRREILPPKSTCFYPRVPSGLLVHEW